MASWALSVFVCVCVCVCVWMLVLLFVALFQPCFKLLVADWTVEGNPAVGLDSTVYVGANDAKLYCLRNGALQWTFAAASSIRASPAVDATNTVYIGDDAGTVYAVTGPNQRHL